MEKKEVKELVNRFLDGERRPLEKAMREGAIRPSVLVGVLNDLDAAEGRDRIQKTDDLERLGREIAKNSMNDDDPPPATDEELEALGLDIAKAANGER